jgi:hypothetical protein
MTIDDRRENGGADHLYDAYRKEQPSRIEDSVGVLSQPLRPYRWWMDSRVWSLLIMAAILARTILVLLNH